MICNSCGFSQNVGGICQKCGSALPHNAPPPPQFGAHQPPPSQWGAQPPPPPPPQWGAQPPPPHWGGQPPSHMGGAFNDPNMMNHANVREGNSKAKSALICGIIGLFCFGFILGIIALVQGIQARAMLSRAGQPTGTAIAGIVLGIIALVVWAGGMLLWIPFMW